MLSRDMRQNLASVVAIAKKFSDFIGAENLINLFQDFKSFEGLYHFLGHIVNCSQLPSVHLKYIEAAAKMQQFKEVQRVCRDSTVYDPLEVKALLLDMKLADPRPLIHVCDRFDFVEEMTEYLFSNNLKNILKLMFKRFHLKKHLKLLVNY
jgi:clathrin heavy chain